MAEAVSAELVAEAIDLLRDIAKPIHRAGSGIAWVSVQNARRLDALIAELPAPVDPDLLLAREAVRDAHDPEIYLAFRDDVLAGRVDDCSDVRSALAAIKRVRAERGE